jgi:AcrR family transcriptional regulator
LVVVAEKKKKTGARLAVDERRAQLIDLALTLFSKKSYDEVSIDDLARSAKISKGLVYHYFPTKRHLYVAGLREAARQLVAATEPPTADISLERDREVDLQKVAHGLESYFDFVEEKGPAFLALMRGGVGSDPQVARVVEETRVKLMSRILQQAPRELDRPIVRAALRGWIGFVEAASIRWLEKRDTTRSAIVKLSIDLFFAAIASAATK